MTPAQQAALQVWYEDEEWAWEAVDPDGDGLFEIRIGPVNDGRIESVATYRWSKETAMWVGPAGSASSPFLRPDPTYEGPETDAFLARLAGRGAK